MCLAMNDDVLPPGERCASTSNRNFEGRQGKGSRTHLVSPMMAAAAAIEGHFVDIRKWNRERSRITMQPFIKHTGLVAPMDRVNVDTDQMVPKQFIKLCTREGFGRFLFYDWRYLPGEKPNPEFVLNRPRYKGASVLLARGQFRLRFEPRACTVGDSRLRLSRNSCAELRRHFLQQLLQERHSSRDAVQ